MVFTRRVRPVTQVSAADRAHATLEMLAGDDDGFRFSAVGILGLDAVVSELRNRGVGRESFRADA